MSEDCLALNVFAPTGIDEKLPVMVWIHGGGFVTGAGGNPFYDRLADHGVVVVTINYRLGRFGWFAHPALEQEAAGGPTANYGFLDQIAALKRIRENIGSFGGDAKNVTVFGESAGAMSIGYLMASPAAGRLFQKAIIQSGLGREPPHPLEEEEALGVQFAKAAGLKERDADSLRRLDQEAISNAKKPPPARSLGSFGPILDGNVIAGDPSQGVFHPRRTENPFAHRH